MFKRIINSDGFKIYFWPIVLCYLFTIGCGLLFAPFEAGSQREAVFVLIGGAAWILCLWILVVRYRKVTGKSVGRRCKILLTIVSAISLLCIALGAVRTILHHF